MNISTIKKLAFTTGLVLFFIMVLGLFYVNEFYVDEDIFYDTLEQSKATPFALLSLLASALMIYGVITRDNTITLKRCKTICVIGAIIWIYLIISMFFLDSYGHGLYFLNVILLFISSTALLIFGIKYSMNKGKGTLKQ